MVTLLGSERTAALPGIYRTACTMAAMILMAACAREMILPAFARPAAASSATTVQQKTQPISLNAPPKPRVLTRIKSGLASWYGEVLQNHLTASGRRFDK